MGGLQKEKEVGQWVWRTFEERLTPWPLISKSLIRWRMVPNRTEWALVFFCEARCSGMSPKSLCHLISDCPWQSNDPPHTLQSGSPLLPSLCPFDRGQRAVVSPCSHFLSFSRWSKDLIVFVLGTNYPTGTSSCWVSRWGRQMRKFIDSSFHLLIMIYLVVTLDFSSKGHKLKLTEFSGIISRNSLMPPY